MPIEFYCPGCKKLLRTPDESAGKQAKCPQCAAIVQIPVGPIPAGPPPPAAFAPQPPSNQPSYPVSNPFPSPAPQFPNELQPFPNNNPFSGGGGQSGGMAPNYDSSNPYATFGSVPAPLPVANVLPRIPLEHTIITFDQIWSNTWNYFSPRIGQFILLGLVVIGANIALNILSFIVNFASQLTGDIRIILVVQIPMMLFVTAIRILLTAGQTLYVLNLIRTGEAKIGDIFGGVRFVLPIIGYVLILGTLIAGLVTVVVVPVVVAAYAVGPNKVDNNPLPVVGTGALMTMIVVPFAAWIFLRFILAITFIVDQNQGPIQALTHSWTYMRGNVLTLFLIYLVIGTLGTLFVVFTCGFGLLLYIPYFQLTNVMLYLYITGQMRGGQSLR